MNFPTFAIIASLSERLLRADDPTLRLRGAFDVHSLVGGILRAKDLFLTLTPSYLVSFLVGVINE